MTKPVCDEPGHMLTLNGTHCVTCARIRARGPSLSPKGMDVVSDQPRQPVLPANATARKNAPIARGVLDYFPRAIAAVAELSRIGNEQHNPGEPMHWAKEKSTDHADCIARHLIDRGTVDTDTVRHSTKVAWRALAMLEIELEVAEGTQFENCTAINMER